MTCSRQINKHMTSGLQCLCIYLKHGVCLLYLSWTICAAWFSWWGHQRCTRFMMTHSLTCYSGSVQRISHMNSVTFHLNYYNNSCSREKKSFKEHLPFSSRKALVTFNSASSGNIWQSSWPISYKVMVWTKVYRDCLLCYLKVTNL